MSPRDRILAETLARLEAERFAGPRRPELTPPPPSPLPDISAEQAEANARVLLDALSDTEDVIHLRRGA